MVPMAALVIPTFVLLSGMGLLNTMWAVILPSLLSPVGLVRVYVQSAVPEEVLDAGRVDGGWDSTLFPGGSAIAAAGDRHCAAPHHGGDLEQLLPALGRPAGPGDAAGHGGRLQAVGPLEPRSAVAQPPSPSDVPRFKS